MQKITDWSEWATAKSYMLPFIYTTPDENVALMLATMLNGTVYKVREGHVISLPRGTMVQTHTHANEIAAATIRIAPTWERPKEIEQ